MAIDIFGSYGMIIGQILSLIAVAGLLIQVARWAEKKHVTRDWFFFILTVTIVVSMQMFSILRFDATSDQLTTIERQNNALLGKQLANQNTTLLNQELIKAALNTTITNQGLIKHSLNESHVDSALIKRDLNNTNINNKLILQIVKDLSFHVTNQSLNVTGPREWMTSSGKTIFEDPNFIR